MKRRTSARLTAFGLSLALLLTSCGSGGNATATTMHLRKTEGTVGVSDGAGKDLEPAENLGLYSGYGVDTKEASYAWIDLDEVKLTKMDENSQIEIKKEDKHLTIEVKSGSLFFNITEPLADDETLDIRTSTMLVGIRGTCGWVEVPDGEHMKVFLLEGQVECTAGENTATVKAGEMATMTSSGDITVEKFSVTNVPAFVVEEVDESAGLAEAILDASGIDIAKVSREDYKSALDELKKEGRILYTEIVDFEADGNPELLVLHTREYREEINDELFAYSIFRKGPDGIDELLFSREPLYEGRGIKSIFSLVESNGRMYLETRRLSGDGRVIYLYDGSAAEKDGINPSWSGDAADWGMLYSINESTYDGRTRYRIDSDFETHEKQVDDEERYHEIRGKFSPVKVLAYGPGDGSLIVLPDPSEIEGYVQPAVTEPEPEDSQPDDGQPVEPDNNTPSTPPANDQPEEPDPQEPEPVEDAEGGDNTEDNQGAGQDFLEQYRQIIQQANSYQYDVWPANANEGLRYALVQEAGFSVPTLILEKLGLDRHGFLLFRYDPSTGTTDNVGSDSMSRFDFPSHSFINDISYDEWHNITDTSALDAWASTIP